MKNLARNRVITPIAVTMVLATSGCGGTDQSGPYLFQGDPGPVHISDLVFDQTNDRLVAATLTGLFVAAPNGTPRRLGDRMLDATAVAVDRDGNLLASGHFDPRSGKRQLAGLLGVGNNGSLREIPGSQTRFFTELKPVGGRLYAFDPVADRLLAGDLQLRTFSERRVPANLYDLAVDPGTPSRLVVTSFRGSFASADAGRSWRKTSDHSGLLAWRGDGKVVLLAPTATYVSTDGGLVWRYTGRPGFRAIALAAAADGTLYAATHRGDPIYRSRDTGRSWQPLP